jgi:hypothetical protein
MSGRTAEPKSKKKKTVRGIDTERGETVLLVARPSIAAVWYRYVVTLGVYGLWRRQDLSVLTDRRVLVGKGILRRTEHSVPLANINDAVYQRKLFFAYCEISSTVRGRNHVQRVGPLSVRQARLFTQEILWRR